MRYHCKHCTYETDSRLMMKDHAAVLGHFGWEDLETKTLMVTRLDEQGNPTDETKPVRLSGIEVGGVLTGRFSPDEIPIKEIERPFPDTYVMNLTVAEVDPAVLSVLTNGVFGHHPSGFSLDIITPARRRTFWEWLRRKPKHHAVRTYFPHVRLATDE